MMMNKSNNGSSDVRLLVVLTCTVVPILGGQGVFVTHEGTLPEVRINLITLRENICHACSSI
jgi:hypothetical protein